MKLKQQWKRRIAWLLILSLCFSPFLLSGEAAQAATGTLEQDAALHSPIIEADGMISWDCVYFGSYWQSLYVPQPENQPEQGEADVIHTDTDGTKYLVREDKRCYKSEPVKWRVLSVSEDGRDALLIADKNLDTQPYHAAYSSDTSITWENSDVRRWLNDDFLKAAFTAEEQAGILPTEIQNKKSPEYELEENEPEEASTTDSIYLPSREDITNPAYGFTDKLADTIAIETRETKNTDFAGTGLGTAKPTHTASDYLLRTMRTKNRPHHVSGNGTIPTQNTNALLGMVNEISRIRPMLRLDLTKTGLWRPADKVTEEQDQKEPAPEPVDPPVPGVTMAPGQVYPKNPSVNEKDETKNTWDCIYFGTYYNTRFTPADLAESGEHDTVKVMEPGTEAEASYLVRHEQGYFLSEPIKWRILSINSDGTDAFVIADKAIDIAQYYSASNVEITWEKSALRQWLNDSFLKTAFTADEQKAVKTTTVKTADNQTSSEPGGNDTQDKIYLPSIEEMHCYDYGFSAQEDETQTRKTTSTDYAWLGGTPFKRIAGFMSYWLRSPGTQTGYPATVGDWGNGTVKAAKAEEYLGVRPVMHVDLSDTSLWSYAGQVTPKGIVTPEPEKTDTGTKPAAPTKKPDDSTTKDDQIQKPQNKPDTTVKKPGKPKIKKLKNKKGKKVTLTLSRKVSGAKGYQAAYATKSSMKKQKKKSFKDSSVTIKGLKKKKTYYFRVRAYKMKNGKKLYGSWSSKKRIKIRK